MEEKRYFSTCFVLTFHKGQVQGPAPGEEQPHAPVQAQGNPAEEQLCGEGPGCAGGQQINHEPTVCPGC